jgi:Leucine rich repeat
LLCCVTLIPSHSVSAEIHCEIINKHLEQCTITNITENDGDLAIEKYGTTKLIIANSTIPHLPQLLPKRMSELTVINCGLQGLMFTGNEIFSKFSMLNASNNKIQKLENSTFHNTPNLKVMNLSSNQILEIASTAFHGLVYLEELDLSHNQLQITDFEEFLSSATNMMIQRIDISHNLLERVIGLHTLIALKKVDLSFNVGLDLTDCWSESVLELSINGIDLTDREQSLQSLEKFENLETLNLEESSITHMTIPQLKNLTRLSLAGNKLSKLKPSEIKMKLPNLTSLIVTNNPWDCYALARMVIEFGSEKLNILPKNDSDLMASDTNIHGIDCVMYDKQRSRLLLLILLGILAFILVIICATIGKVGSKKKDQEQHSHLQASESSHSVFEQELIPKSMLGQCDLTKVNRISKLPSIGNMSVEEFLGLDSLKIINEKNF